MERDIVHKQNHITMVDKQWTSLLASATFTIHS